MIRSKGEAGTGDIVEAVRHLRTITGEIRRLQGARRRRARDRRQGARRAARPRARDVAETGRLPVVMFCAGGIATPADAALVMQLGAEGVFVGSGIFKSEDPETRARRGRRGDDALPGLGPRAEGLRGPRRGDAVARGAQARRGPAPGEPRLVSAPRAGACSSASSRSRATSRRTRRCSRGLGATVREVRVPARPRGARRARHARRRVDDDDARHRARGARRAAARVPAAGRPMLGTCAGLIMLDREHLGVMDIVAPSATRSAARSTASRRTSTSGSRAARCAPCSSARRGCRARAGRRGARRGRRPSGRRARGPRAGDQLPPELSGDTRAARGCSSRTCAPRAVLTRQTTSPWRMVFSVTTAARRTAAGSPGRRPSCRCPDRRLPPNGWRPTIAPVIARLT